MALLDALIDDVASRFGLGAAASPLVREALALIAGSGGGLAELLDRFKRAGLGSLALSWLGAANPEPLAAGDLAKALGAPAIDSIAHRLGVALPAASAALAYTLPKLIALLTPNGVVPAALPAEAAALLGTVAADDHGHAAEVKHIRARKFAPAWLWPLVAVGAVAGLGWAVWPILFPGPAPQSGVRVGAAQTAPAPAPASAPAPAPAASLTSVLSVANDEGVAEISSAVRDDKTRASILDALKGAFGADKVKGDIAVEANRSDAPWLASVGAALGALKIPGVRATFEGASVNVGGAIVDADRQKIAASLKSIYGAGLTVGDLTDAFFGAEGKANADAARSIATLRTGFSGGDLVATMNRIAVNFPYGATDVPASVQSLLGNVAALVKTLPAGQGLEVAGYTDTAGDAGANLALSQKRAEAVRDALVAAGVPADKLVAKGYGGANPIAGNDTEEGRFRNRRIEYHLIDVPAAPAAASTAAAAPPPAPAAAPAPAPAAAAPTSPSTLTIEEAAGGVTVSGAVPDEATRGSILETLKAAFGADGVKGGLNVDSARAAPPWLAKLAAALDALKLPGLKATFDGGAISLGGGVPEVDRDKIAAALRSLFGDGITVGSLAAPSAGDWAAAANAKAATALAALKGGYSGADAVGALNLSIVNFATDSAEVPGASLGFLHDAAAVLKALPPGYAIEIAGYTDNTGDAEGNIVLSRKRAQSVRDALVEAGAPADMLEAKGYGAADPVDSNDTEEGRLHNRRIEYHVARAP